MLCHFAIVYFDAKFELNFETETKLEFLVKSSWDRISEKYSSKNFGKCWLIKFVKTKCDIIPIPIFKIDGKIWTQRKNSSKQRKSTNNSFHEDFYNF